MFLVLVDCVHALSHPRPLENPKVSGLWARLLRIVDGTVVLRPALSFLGFGWFGLTGLPGRVCSLTSRVWGA